MDQRHELTPHSPIPFKLFLHRLKTISMHFHDSIEILFLLSGSASIRTEDSLFNLIEDDIILLNPNQLHELESSDCVMVVLQIAPTLFTTTPEEALPLFACNSASDKDPVKYHNLKVLISKLIKVNTEKNAHLDIKNKALLFDLFYELTCNFLSQSTKHFPIISKKMDRLTRIIDRISENYQSDISLSQIAEEEYLSVSYLSRYIEKNLGQSFKSFLSSVRLTHAFNDLMSSSDSIDSIAERNGFPNTRSFVSVFKEKYDALPSAYRKLNSVTPSTETEREHPFEYGKIEQSNYLAKLGDYLNDDIQLINTATTDMHLITIGEIDVRKSKKKLKHTFKNILSIGKATDLLDHSVQKMFTEIQSEIGFKYIQFHGFLGDDIVRFFYGTENEGDFNYDILDTLLDIVLKNGGKPLLKLGFEHKDSLLITELLRSPSTMSKSLKKWIFILKDLMRHLFSRYGRTEVLTWIFTLQEEVDQAILTINKQNEVRFSQLYLSTFKTIKAIDQQVIFGPSPLMPYMLLDTPIVEAFFEFCLHHRCTPDFLSFKFFPVVMMSPSQDAAKKNLQLSTEPDSLKLFIEQFKERLQKAHLNHLPVYMTQWNSSISNRELLNDTCFKSAYIAKNILENYDSIDSFSYWQLTDYNSEFRPGKELYHGGLGLFTKNGIKKAAYNSFWLLSKLGNQLLDSGDGYFVTKSDDTIQILLYHYVHYTPLYATGETYNMTHLDRYTPFSSLHTKEFDITLTHINRGVYISSEYSVSQQSGSSFDAWISMFSMPVTTEEEITLLKAKSLPGLVKRKIEVTEKNLKLQYAIEPHEVKLIKIVPELAM